MKLTTLFADDHDAVSPVIGVILMVAITVILAAVIGTFVLGQADQLNENAPTTDFDFEGQSGSGNNYDVIHAGGDDFDAGNVNVGYTESTTNSRDESWGSSGTTVTSGDSITIGDDDTNGDTTNDGVKAGSTIRVNWASGEGGSSSTIGQYTVPS